MRWGLDQPSASFRSCQLLTNMEIQGSRVDRGQRHASSRSWQLMTNDVVVTSRLQGICIGSPPSQSPHPEARSSWLNQHFRGFAWNPGHTNEGSCQFAQADLHDLPRQICQICPGNLPRQIDHASLPRQIWSMGWCPCRHASAVSMWWSWYMMMIWNIWVKLRYDDETWNLSGIPMSTFNAHHIWILQAGHG